MNNNYYWNDNLNEIDITQTEIYDLWRLDVQLTNLLDYIDRRSILPLERQDLLESVDLLKRFIKKEFEINE